MALFKNKSIAEQTENFTQILGYAIFGASIFHGLEAAEYLVNDQLAKTLSNASLALGIVIMAIVLPLGFRVSSLRKQDPSGYAEPEGFVIEMFKKAAFTAFALTFLFTAFLKILPRKFYPDLPPGFWLELTMIFSTLVFGLAFFFLSRAGGEETTEDGQ